MVDGWAQASAEELEEARALWQSDDIQIDDDAVTSKDPDNEGGGYFIQAWVWVDGEGK